MAVIWIICAVVIWYIYHSLFSVVYFKGGCLTEFIVIAMVSAFVAAAIATFWYITIPVLLIVLYIAIKAKKSK